jgi:hypothetical protein
MNCDRQPGKLIRISRASIEKRMALGFIAPPLVTASIAKNVSKRLSAIQK